MDGDVADSQIKDIIEKVKSGVLAEADLDICVKRILQYLVKTPAFRAYKYSNKPDLKAHADVTRRCATEGMVLLKNEKQTLPFGNTKTVSVFGITSYDFIAGGTGSGDVNKAHTIDMMQGLTEAGLKVNSKLANLYQSYKAYQESITAAGPARGGWFWGAVTSSTYRHRSQTSPLLLWADRQAKVPTVMRKAISP